ncbi:flagellar basal-body MS-ring/collar protein FliF [Desulfopila inferna]|uniref:flagellar basal-body MS-ring/collar protein FliF n=1 Tax=Desulfopila inferna TaxID=468528 RepID=UPI00196370E4|nr:flagellar basal-body MS-ring/collar protein FliF [Desulfopila inferna]MBM9602969.1 flagellar M-ring protein FliF [Desulfopila inferna]
MAEETLPAGETTLPTASSEQAIERKNLTTLIKEWPLSRKLALVGVILISVTLFGILIFQGKKADYQLLYANLAENDAAPVVAWLKGENIPYELKNNGRNIWIPAAILHETRLNLAGNGLPAGNGVGFEVFDKQSFALTDYVQKVNYTRALQGELSRTIATLEPVVSARVHLALPEKRLFKNQQKQATASVILSLAKGKTLDQKQVQGIVHLVAGSITGLTPENITVIDSNGMALDAGQKEDEDKYFSVDMLAYQQEVEQRLEIRAQDLLDRTMGRDKAMVRVSAALDFSKVEKTEELFDSEEPVIRSEQINQEENGKPAPAGIPGVQSNLDGIDPLQAEASSNSRTSRTTNYEISKTISKIINPVGTIKNLSVSILVADRVVPASENAAQTVVPRTDEELNSLQTMVATALGLNAERGDQINVLSMPFTEAPREVMVAEKLPDNLLYEYLPFVKIGLFACGALMLYLLLVRPVIKTLRGEVKEHYKTVEALELEQQQTAKALAMEKREAEELISEDPLVLIRRKVMENPTPAAHIIKNWLQEA